MGVRVVAVAFMPGIEEQVRIISQIGTGGLVGIKEFNGLKGEVGKLKQCVGIEGYVVIQRQLGKEEQIGIEGWVGIEGQAGTE